jgi:cytochrome c oxidase subunit 4
VLVAVILCVVTAIEIAVSYTEGDIPDALIIVLLLGMAVIKFALVAAWFMHLRTDKPIFRRFFILGIVAAILLYLIVLATLHAID